MSNIFDIPNFSPAPQDSIEQYGGTSCGDALSNYLNSGPLKGTGLTLPSGGIGPGEVAKVGEARGSGIYRKDDLTTDNLTPGMVIHMTRQPGDRYYDIGKTHIGIVDIDEGGNKVFKSFTAGKGWRADPITPRFIAALPAKITAANLINPELTPTRSEMRASKVAVNTGPVFDIPNYQPEGEVFDIETPSQTPETAATPLTAGMATAGESNQYPGIMGMQDTPPLAMEKRPQTSADIPENLRPANVLKKVLTPPSIQEVNQGVSDLFQPGGYDRLNEKAANQLASPEAAVFAALDPMVAVAGLGGVKEVVKPVTQATSPQLQALSKVVTGVGEKYNPNEIKKLMSVAKNEFGIDLTVPELTNSPTLRALWTRLAKTPGPQSEKLANYIQEVRNPQIATAIEQELKNISPSNMTGWQSGGAAKIAAQNIEESLKRNRKTTTKPLYKAAFETAQPVNIEPVLTDIQSALAKYPEGHPSRAALQQVEKMLTEDAAEIAKVSGKSNAIDSKIPIGDLEILHNAKTGIDQLLQKAKQDKSIDNDTRRLLTNIKAKLTGAMERDNPLYGDAQKTFRLLSKPLNDFRYGNANLQPRDPHIKTVIARVADLGAEDVEKVTEIIFSAKPGQIARTKKYFEKAYPGTWDAIVRSHIENKLNRIKDTVIEREGNVGGVLKRTVFNDASDKLKLRFALSPAKYSRFERFMDILDKTRRIIYTNSDTAFQIEAGKVLEQGGAKEIIGNIPTSKAGVIKWVASQFDKVSNPMFAGKLADAMLNGQNAMEISKLAKLPNTPDKALKTAIFIENVTMKGRPTYENK